MRARKLHREHTLFLTNLHDSKAVGGVYSEDIAASTVFGQLQALRFQVHAFLPQGTAPFLVQSSPATRLTPRAHSRTNRN